MSVGSGEYMLPELGPKALDYLLRLEETLREATSARAAVDAACQQIGRFLDVATAGFIEVEPNLVDGFVVSEWRSGRLPPMVGAHRVPDYGPDRLDALRAGSLVAVPNVEKDPRTSGSSSLAAIRNFGISAFVEAPLLAEDRLRGWLYLSVDEPRDWSPEELALIAETVRRAGHAAERARAEEALREREARLEAVLEQMPVGVILAGMPDGELLLYNKASSEIMGHDMLGQVLTDYGSYGGIHLDGRPYQAEDYPTARAVLHGERIVAEPLRYRRPDGRIVRLSVSAAPIRSRYGDFAVCTFQDETALHAASERLQLLNTELAHRVKNMLSAIQSIASQSFRRSDEREAFDGRLQALAAAYNLLTNTDWQGELYELVHTALEPFLSEDRFVIEGDPVELEQGQAVSFALALHELATNAVKYGALSVPAGRVQITWRMDETAERLAFQWREVGGPPVAYPERRGFGSRLLERNLAVELRGKVYLDFDPTGVICTMDVLVSPKGAA